MVWILTILALLYILSPYDLIPDFIPLRGWIDDIVVLVFMVRYLSRIFKIRKQYRNEPGEETKHSNGPDRNQDHRGGNPHQVLGVSANASADEIRQAYRKLANQYHPDKVAHLGDEFRAMAEERFKEIQTAYDRLSR